jgi:hypothetical protein
MLRGVYFGAVDEQLEEKICNFRWRSRFFVSYVRRILLAVTFDASAKPFAEEDDDPSSLSCCAH